MSACLFPICLAKYVVLYASIYPFVSFYTYVYLPEFAFLSVCLLVLSSYRCVCLSKWVFLSICLCVLFLQFSWQAISQSSLSISLLLLLCYLLSFYLLRLMPVCLYIFFFFLCLSFKLWFYVYVCLSVCPIVQLLSHTQAEGHWNENTQTLEWHFFSSGPRYSAKSQPRDRT